MLLLPSILHIKWRLTILLCLLAFRLTLAQTLENVRTTFDQSSQLMRINYDLKGLGYKKEIKIIPYVVRNDSSEWLKSLSGDFGWLNRGGKNKLVLWDPFKDGVDSLAGAQVKILTQIRDAKTPTHFALALHGSNSAPFGLKILPLSEKTLYIGFRMGRTSPSYKYTAANSGEMNYLESGVYQFTGKRRLAGFAITAGSILQMGRKVYLYTGLGYGVERLFWEYEAFNLEKVSLGNFWALNESINRKGGIVEAGVLFHLGPLVLDLGMATIKLKSWQLIAGIGWVLAKNRKM